MLNYFISDKDQLPYHLAVKIEFQNDSNPCRLRIPFWRPGRYSPGNFPGNFIDIDVRVNGMPVVAQKADPFTIMFSQASGAVEVTYRVYARNLSAGNTYSSDSFLLINPVNSLMYVEGFENEKATIQTDFEKNGTIATSLTKTGENKFEARDMQELMDSPMLCSANLSEFHYRVDDCDFHVHIHGNIAFGMEDLIDSFKAFTKEQIRNFGSFPVKEYHFLLAILPYQTYHGVEHEKSTVIILGPDKSLEERSTFRNLLGVSSHELYHTWNVKFLRPSDWSPYDFTKAGFSRMGYIAEGITTYMGDLMLWKSGVFSDREFLDELSNVYKRHQFNEGRYHASLADSSVDTWVDGYERGMPRRKLSIYTEGAWLAFICDVFIIDKTVGESDLSTVMRLLYRNVNPEKGFTEEDFWNAVAETADFSWDLVRNDLVDGRGNWDKWLEEAFSLAGLSIEKLPSHDPLLRNFGFALKKVNENHECIHVFEGSPAEKAGLWFDDRVIEINGKNPDEIKDDLGSELTVKILSDQQEKGVEIIANGISYGHGFRFDWSENDSLFRSHHL